MLASQPDTQQPRILSHKGKQGNGMLAKPCAQVMSSKYYVKTQYEGYKEESCNFKDCIRHVCGNDNLWVR